MKKRLNCSRAVLCILLVMLMMNSGLAGGIVAYAFTPTIHYIEDEIYNASPDDPDAPAMNYTLEEYIKAEMQKCATSIDISSYYISASRAGEVASMIYDNMPELFHVSRLGYTTMFNYILTLNPEYRCTAEEYTDMYNVCVEGAEKLLNGIKDNALLTDVQKALLLHDRIATLCDYDYDNYLNNAIPWESYSMYGVFGEKKAVCQGYAEAYQYLLDAVSIESCLCESDALSHVWNIVEIDGVEYHVDITWDDPVYDVTGRVKHTNFLRSSEGIYSTGHEATDYITTPDSTLYDDAFWQKSTTAFQLVGNEIYYIDETDSMIKKYSDHSSVASVADTWWVSASSYYRSNYARLSSNGTYLYYNSSKAVFELDPVSGTATQIWQPETDQEYFNIYGFKYEDYYLYCDLYSSPSFKSETKPVYQQKKYYRSAADSADLVGIELNMESIQTEYDLGEAFNSEGFSILLIYDDNTEVVVTEGFTIYCGDTSSEGQKTVIVVYRSLDKTYTTSYAITVACQHKAIIDVPAAASTCTVQGNTAYSKCNICKRIISGSDELLPFAKHDYISSVISALTCTTDGITVYTCSACSDSYTETITASGHAYTTALTAPTCTERGYTTYTCECGDTYVADYVDANGHNYASEITTPATHLTEGVRTFTCKCGDTYTEAIAKLTKHDYKSEVTTPATHLAEGVMTYTCACGDTYTEAIAKTTGHSHNSVVTAPTCTERGYTTYTCECGDTYVADYVDANGHNYASEITTPATHLTEGVRTFTCKCGDTYTEAIAKLTKHDYKSEVTTPATHLAEGVMTYTCACGDTYTEAIAKTTGHSHNSVVTAPTCTERGYTTYTCECGDTYVSEYVAKTEHEDHNGDFFCDFCGEELEQESSNNCSHLCHQSGIMGIFWKIIRFFWKLFGMNPVCECGKAHY